MRPVKVEFQAFGPYAGYEMVDFDAISGKGLFLICGKTGIGKTMILDAITFALYGKSSGHGRDDFESMRCTNADFNTDTFVRFEFENRGEYYLFERRLERKRKNLSPSYNVSRKNEDGIWNPLMENAKEKALNETAVRIIGLEYEQFRQVIVLPQGQFERLLTSNSDEKEKILTSIFGEVKWQAIADRFYEKAENRKNEIKAVRDKILNSLREEGCDSIDMLELAVAGKRDQISALETEYHNADYDKIIKEQQDMLVIAKRFGDMHKAEERLKELETQKADRKVWEAALIDGKRALKVGGLMEAEKASEKAFLSRKKDEENAGKAAEIKRQAYEEASESLRLHLDKEKDIEGLKSKRILLEGKRGIYEGLEDVEKKLTDAQKALYDAQEAEREAGEKQDLFTGQILILQDEYAKLQTEHERLLNAYLAGITGELAAKLTPGDPCPVCGSTEHPHKAEPAVNGVTREEVDSKKKSAESKYNELKERINDQDKAKKEVLEKHAVVEGINTEIATLKERIDSRKKNLAEGVSSLKELEKAIKELSGLVDEYEKIKIRLTEEEKSAKDTYIESQTMIESAKREAENARTVWVEAGNAVGRGLADNGFDTREEAQRLMLTEEEMEELSSRIALYDADIKTAGENLKSIRNELEGSDEPDEKNCREILDNAVNAQGEYREKRALLTGEIERLENKAKTIRKDGDGIEERIREAEADFAFAKKLRGDSGTGLSRYVLGIMFSSVVAAANKMLEMVHGGRYRLFRSDEKAQGSNKRGLELKVLDKNSEEHDGRFVSTLSGGEKFLASLALSIGMSTVAQRSGIKIEALFIDEGFGSLDEDSIEDAMNILGSIQKANGLVGIISHIQLLQDQIPNKLLVEECDRGSHIVQTIG